MEIRHIYIVSDPEETEALGLALRDETPKWCLTYKYRINCLNLKVKFYSLNKSLVQYNLYIWVQQLF